MTQPEALRLADVLEDAGKPADIAESAAAELRRLHAELERCKQVCAATAEIWREENENTLKHFNEAVEGYKKMSAQRDALLGALKQVEPILARMYGAQAAQLPPMQTVRAAIAKAEENA